MENNVLEAALEGTELSPVEEYSLINDLATLSHRISLLQWIRDCYVPPILDLPNVLAFNLSLFHHCLLGM